MHLCSCPSLLNQVCVCECACVYSCSSTICILIRVSPLCIFRSLNAHLPVSSHYRQMWRKDFPQGFFLLLFLLERKKKTQMYATDIRLLNLEKSKNIKKNKHKKRESQPLTSQPPSHNHDTPHTHSNPSVAQIALLLLSLYLPSLRKYSRLLSPRC